MIDIVKAIFFGMIVMIALALVALLSIIAFPILIFVLLVFGIWLLLKTKPFFEEFDPEDNK